MQNIFTDYLMYMGCITATLLNIKLIMHLIDYAYYNVFWHFRVNKKDTEGRYTNLFKIQ